MFALINKLMPAFFSKLFKSLLFLIKHSAPQILQRSASVPSEVSQIKSLTLILGHSHFLKANGGTEKIILEQTEELLSQERDSLFIYPQGSSARNLFLKPCRYGVILNGYEMPPLSKSQLQSFLEGIQGTIKEVRLHHWLFWPLRDLRTLLNALKRKNISLAIYIHDFYFHCPKVNYFCRQGPKKCQASFLRGVLKFWRRNQEDLLHFADQLLVPSEFIGGELPSLLREKYKVFPQIKFENTKKLKLAYLGVPSAIKGFDTWEKIIANPLLTRSFEFYQVGSESNKLEHVRCIPYSYKASKANQATEILLEEQIDLVLLWSQVPESYSLTLHEAMAAGKFIITCNQSGNIAKMIGEQKAPGVVLGSEYELFQYLLRREATKPYAGM